MRELSLDDATARAQMKGLKDNKWIDAATSAVIVSINAYNGNLDTYVVVTVTFEMPNTGRVFPVMDVKANRLFKYYRQYDQMRLICEILVCSFLVYFISEEYANIVKIGSFYDWATEDIFRVLDIVNLGLFFVQIPLHMYIFFLVENSGLDKPSAVYQELSGIFYLVTIELQLNATNISLMYLKVFKYTRRIHMVKKILEVYKKAGEDLYVFNMMLLIVLLGFAQAGFVAFGAYSASFCTYITSIGTMFKSLTREFDYVEMKNQAPMFAPLFFFTWTFLVIFLLLKNVPAILCFAYQSVNLSANAVEVELNKPGRKLAVQQSLKFVYLMRHDGERDVNGLIASIQGFEDSVVTTLLTEEALIGILEKWPVALSCTEYATALDLIDAHDSDSDHKLDKTDAAALRQYLNQRLQYYEKLWMVCNES